MNRSEVAEAAAVLRRLLQRVEDGDLSDGGPPGRGLHDRLKGAVVALEAVAGTEGKVAR